MTRWNATSRYPSVIEQLGKIVGSRVGGRSPLDYLIEKLESLLAN